MAVYQDLIGFWNMILLVNMFSGLQGICLEAGQVITFDERLWKPLFRMVCTNELFTIGPGKCIKKVNLVKVKLQEVLLL